MAPYPTESVELLDRYGRTYSVMVSGPEGKKLALERYSREAEMNQISNPLELPQDRIQEYHDPAWVKDYRAALEWIEAGMREE